MSGSSTDLFYTVPELVFQALIRHFLRKIKKDRSVVDRIFGRLNVGMLSQYYGNRYIDSIWNWLSNTDIYVVKSWSLDAQKIPSVSIHISSEYEDESKGAIGDYFGQGENYSVGVNVFSVNVTIGIHADRSSDQVMWLYYLISYILFKYKRAFEYHGIHMHTFGVSENNKEAVKMPENIWSKWISLRCTVANFFNMENYVDIEEVNIFYDNNLPPFDDIFVDDNLSYDLDPQVNKGFQVDRLFDEDSN